MVHVQKDIKHVCKDIRIFSPFVVKNMEATTKNINNESLSYGAYVTQDTMQDCVFMIFFKCLFI